MQTNHAYQNLVRTLELANQNKLPYVPFDKNELRMLPVHIAINHLPVDPGNLEDKDWSHYVNVYIRELGDSKKADTVSYSDFLTNLGLLIEDPSKLKMGVVVMPNRLGFTIYKQ